MKPKIVYEKGYKFDGTRLTFVEEAGHHTIPSGQKQRMISVECECGKIFSTRLAGIKNKNTRSCGCLKLEIIKETGNKNKTHGLTNHPMYYLHKSMRDRCYKENNKDYENYGARGITVCDEWLGPDGFPNFLRDMGERPDGMTLDRIDGDKGYSKENCRWADYHLQGYNQRKSKNNTSGRTGIKVSKVHEDGSKTFQAYIGWRGKLLHLITTKDYELVEFCRSEAEIHFYGHNKE